MLGADVAAQLPFLRASAESLMVESLTFTSVAGAGFVAKARRRPGVGSSAAVPAGAQASAFSTARLALPWSVSPQPGTRVDGLRQRFWVGAVSESSQMVECRVDVFRPAAPVPVSVTTAASKDPLGNTIPGQRDKYTVPEAALFGVESKDATDLSQLSTTVVKVWLPPGSELLSGWEVRDMASGLRYLVTGDPVVSPLGVVAQLKRGIVAKAA